jgi:hypothetical protein
VSLVSDEIDHSYSLFRLQQLETEKLADGRRKFFWLRTWALLGSFRGLVARLRDFRLNSQIAIALAIRELILIAIIQ